MAVSDTPVETRKDSKGVDATRNVRASVEPLLRIRDLSVQVDDSCRSFFAVRNLSLEVSPGKTLALVGESGSGKTMTALALLDLLPRQARMAGGEISFAGSPLSAGQLQRLRGTGVAMIFQDASSALNPVFRVGNQIRDVIRTHLGKRSKSARQQALEQLCQVGFANPERTYNAYPHQLSGGMAQRAMIAMALSCSPKLIIADEPTTALDVTTQRQILQVIRALQVQRNFALLLISHDLEVVSRLADHVAIMYSGEIVERGVASRLFQDPKHPYTQALLGAAFYTSADTMPTEKCKSPVS